jgi:3-methyladenine DNA glycosylase AlkD
MQTKEIIDFFKCNENPGNLSGMSRYGITTDRAFGISMPVLRKFAKEIGWNHDLAVDLWKTGYHEAHILAALIDEPAKVTEQQMEEWVRDFDSWDVCDQTCSSLFDKTPYAYSIALSWSGNTQEYVKRAGYVMMAVLAVHDKKAPDEKLLQFLPVIEKGATDERNFVKKAVNWALRQIGKRSLFLNDHAIATAKRIATLDSKPARWIASDALRELTDEKTITRLMLRNAYRPLGSPVTR